MSEQWTPYNYELPAGKIAQRPVYPYDAAKMLVIDPQDETIRHSSFTLLPEFLDENHVLVFNDSRVIPARLRAELESGRACEILLIEEVEPGLWRCMGKPLRRLKEGTVFSCSEFLSGKVIARSGAQEILVRFNSREQKVSEALFLSGEMPIPPYIRRGQADEADKKDYQTIFARKEGSVAAPTASLHFTPQLLAALQKRNVTCKSITLHVGPASFLPLWKEDSGEPVPPGSERMSFEPELPDEIIELKEQGKKIIAVGTTVVRALESLFNHEGGGQTDLFITPGYRFKIIDGLITNFHQPRTTHLLLVQAITGRDLLEKSYQEALEKNFRFLSYGDGMFIRSLRGK